MAGKPDQWFQSILKEVFGESSYSKFDETTLDYCISMLKDNDSDAEDLLASMSPMVQSSLDLDEKDSDNKVKLIIDKIRGKKDNVEQSTKILGAPIMIARVIQNDEEHMQNILKTEMPTEVNYNKTISTTIDSVTGVDAAMSDKENRAVMKGNKKIVRIDRKGQLRERRLALEREEILGKLSNKLVKLHENADDKSRNKDIILEEVSMTLTNLELLRDVTITFSHGHKFGLIGRNGLGKTTFLKHLAAHAFPGIPNHLQIVHIEQEVAGDERTVLHTVLCTDIERESLLTESKAIQQLMEKLEKGNISTTAPVAVEGAVENKPIEDDDPYGIKDLTSNELSDQLVSIFERLNEIEADSQPARASAILAGLGFSPEEQNRPTKSFSGGWRMRVSLAQALFISPDILLLDEPTNHLDLHSVLWLEEYLTKYNKTLIIVSHDRDFLNSVTTHVVLLTNKNLIKYKGNYDAFEKQRSEDLKNQQRAHDSQAKAISHMQEYIDKNKVRASTAKMAQSRMKKLAKIELVPEIMNDPTFTFSFPEADDVNGAIVSILDVGFGYSKENLLYKGVSLNVDMESRIALVGPNGAGKSTLLKLILGELEPVEGFVKLNPKARIARFTQHHVDQLDLKKTPLQWFQGMYPETKHQDIRKHLGQYGITGNLALQPIYSLSGGQKSRVAFAHITWKKPHLLLLDEPTNHLDMDTVDALIRACNNWNGGLLIVSHDEHMISTVCETIWVCAGKKVDIFPGDFDDYKTSLMKQDNKIGMSGAKR